MDLGITLQGESEEELPEVILCQARFDCVDLEAGVPVGDIAASTGGGTGSGSKHGKTGKGGGK